MATGRSGTTATTGHYRPSSPRVCRLAFHTTDAHGLACHRHIGTRGHCHVGWMVAMVTPTILAACVLAVGMLWYAAVRLRSHSGLPWADTVHSDMGGMLPVAAPLVSHAHRLIGQPDYLLRRREGLIPVEVKPNRRAKKPYDSDMMQLMAYCLLVEECYGERPPYGLLRYATHTFRVEYTTAHRAEILATIAEMHHDHTHPDCPRSHQQTARCRGCGFWAQCDQSLVPHSEEEE